jgi:hypothetical protein
MASSARRASWLSYDAKRKRTARRLMKERARDAVRRARYQKTGQCEYCGRRGATVWHHLDYRCPLFVDEVCPECHRRLHPRRVNGGKVR